MAATRQPVSPTSLPASPWPIRATSSGSLRAVRSSTTSISISAPNVDDRREQPMDNRMLASGHQDARMTEASRTSTVAALPPLPSFGEATRVWFKIGCLSFGGPAGQIALLHREVVDDRNWVSDRRFLHALNFCHLL